MKKDNAEYVRKKKAAGMGPLLTPPKPTELWTLVAKLINLEVEFAEEQYDSELGDDPTPKDVDDINVGR